MFSVQIVMCLYIIAFFPNMEGQSLTIVEQINSNSFSGAMLFVLSILITLMVIERYIYKSHKFVEKQIKGGSKKQSITRIQQIIEAKNHNSTDNSSKVL